MRTLESSELQSIAGGIVANQVGYGIGYAFGYVLGGGAGRDLGNWLYDTING